MLMLLVDANIIEPFALKRLAPSNDSEGMRVMSLPS